MVALEQPTLERAGRRARHVERYTWRQMKKPEFAAAFHQAHLTPLCAGATTQLETMEAGSFKEGSGKEIHS